MTNKQKIEKWLDKQIKIMQEENKNLYINKSLTLMNASSKSYIHLYGCLHQVAEILELPITRNESTRIDGRPFIEDTFEYNGVKFIQVVKCE